ncbi:MAG: Isopenicillin epimerase [Verrucomicrobiota bacterium]|jgi:isopenicillin-N epimerase
MPLLGRREFLSRAALAGSLPFIAGAAAPAVLPPSSPLLDRSRPPSEVAADESAWGQVQAAWSVDRSIINLENGGVQPSPDRVHAAFTELARHAHRAPPITLNREQLPQLEDVRKRLAAAFGCDADELALTRNTTEGTETVLLGCEFRPGDRVLTTTQDYWRFLNTLKQRVARDGIEIDTLKLPAPDASDATVVATFAAALTPRTRLVLFSQLINLTGRILPARALVELCHSRHIPVVVDGAHGFAHIPARRDDLGCDYYATSLHKWLGAPHGTGFLYVRRDRIGSLWPHFPAPAELRENIRKFESIGTFSAAPFLAIRTALDFYGEIGADHKWARLRSLRERWLEPLAEHPGVIVHVDRRESSSGALATVTLPGLPAQPLAKWLWERHRIVVRPVEHPEFSGIRVTPNLSTTSGEIDTLSAALRTALNQGLD